MGGRGSVGAGGGGVVSENLPFEENVNKLFWRYDMYVEGDMVRARRKPTENDIRWIKANKPKILAWAGKVERENRQLEKRYKEL
ncbi:MAG: hypothetical protein ACPLX7_10500, partial [Candidatus Kapaibacteriota bacterium]